MEKKLDKVLCLLKKFRVEELPKILESAFGCHFWKELKDFAVKRKISLSNSRNVAMICLNIYKVRH